MKTSDLTGALLEYWTARAEGTKPEDLTIRRDQVFRQHHDPKRSGGFARVMDYTTNWALTGPLLRKYISGLDLCIGNKGAYVRPLHAPCDGDQVYGDTELIAICRAIVRAAFGDEVEDIK